ncbi:hypothetical protein N7492_009558 [Penicillium capsulatum]|uniref:Uncharacterized protein n=1 Tax=Penicillium capsulatum TaxID=69766 RepID=A0A9W9HUV5_9EURO|nr:hypothetical protein N7492_009558 [Penicillium capsulatum]KAJ6106946.1 hypothetical protein N7512_010463 [Penicillium capsulatum]
MQLRGSDKEAGIRQIRQTIKERTRHLNEEAKIQEAADQQLHQSLLEELASQQASAAKKEDTNEKESVQSADTRLMRTGWCSIL